MCSRARRRIAVMSERKVAIRCLLSGRQRDIGSGRGARRVDHGALPWEAGATTLPEEGTMTTDETKRLAADFFAALSAGDIDGALARMTDHATWWMAGKREDLPAA